MSEDLRIEEPLFYGKRTLLLLTDVDVFVGMRSVVEGMGLIWARQKQKLKQDRRVQRFQYRCRNRHHNTIFYHKNFVREYLDTVDLSRIPIKKRNTVRIYKEEFFGFITEVTLSQSKNIYDAYTDTGKDGLMKLFKDVYIMNYQSGFEKIAEVFHKLMTDSALNIDELILSNEIHEIADYLSKNQTKLR